jgi:hypothetical protein
MARNRYSAFLYLILVFASGILVGVVSYRLYVTSSVSATQPRSSDEVRKKYLAEMKLKVGVSDAQLESVNRILDDTKRSFDDLNRKQKPLKDAIQQEQVDSVSALLTPEQKVAYNNWRAERARLHEEQKKKLKK